MFSSVVTNPCIYFIFLYVQAAQKEAEVILPARRKRRPKLLSADFVSPDAQERFFFIYFHPFLCILFDFLYIPPSKTLPARAVSDKPKPSLI